MVFTNPVVLPGLKYVQSSPLVFLKAVLAHGVFQLNCLAVYQEKPLLAACGESLPACEGVPMCWRDVALVLVPWGLLNQLPSFQRPPF